MVGAGDQGQNLNVCVREARALLRLCAERKSLGSDPVVTGGNHPARGALCPQSPQEECHL